MTTGEVNLRVAAKALIFDETGKVLIIREAETYKDGTEIGKYGMPGGRIDAAEPFFEGLAREVREETGLEVVANLPVHVDEWWPTIQGVKTHIVAMFIACRPTGGVVKLSDEHDAYQWIKPEDHVQYILMDEDSKAIMAWMAANA
jgi:8-oxo-dGTP diphosphatase